MCRRRYVGDAECNAFETATGAAGNPDEGKNIWLTAQGGLLYQDGAEKRPPSNAEDFRQEHSIRFMLGHPDTNNQGLVQQLPAYLAVLLLQLAVHAVRGREEPPGLRRRVATYRKSAGVRHGYYCSRYKVNPQPDDRTKCTECGT